VSDARKIYGILVFIAIAGFVASGVSGFLRSSFDFGIDAAESQIFDLQVKLRNLSAGNLADSLRGWSAEKQKEGVARLSPPPVSRVFGTDYLTASLSSASPSPSSNVPSSAFPDISLIGVSVKKDVMTATLSVAGNVQIWIFRKENGTWKTKDSPYPAEEVEFTGNHISFVLSSSGEKRKYSFAIAAVPGQYAAP